MGDTWAPAPRANILVRFTRGEQRLKQAFWLLYVTGGAVVWGLAQAVAWTGAPGRILPGALAVLAVAFLPLAYRVWAAVSVWACAFNVDWQPWGYAARIAVVADVLLEFLRSYNMVRSEMI